MGVTRATTIAPRCAVVVSALLMLALLGAALPARAATFYVAPDGSDTNPGTEAMPFATFGRAQTAASAGDTVYFRGGTYSFTSATAADGVVLNKSGTSGARINYWAYAGEVPAFDFSGMTAQARITGLRITASFLHLKGLEVRNVPQNLTTQHESWGIYNTGSNNIYENLNLHHNMGPGLFISKGGNNLALNCDSHHNYDPKSSSGDGTNADGFGCHVGSGDTGNVFRGCRAWWNSDDGFDFIQAQVPCTVEGSWAWRNGYQPDTTTSKGDGNGFKAGGYGVPATNVPPSPPSHIVRFCVAWLNKASGFYANHHPVADYFYNNTSFHNGADFNMMGLNGNVGVLRNNLAYGGTLIANDSGIDAASNSWDLPVTVSDDDFESVSTDGLDAPRKADGSLPDVAFMKLKAGSDLIDRGQDVGLPFNGTAPDLGAFELGGVVIGSAGAGGSGGGAGTSGAAGAGAAGASAAGTSGTSGASAGSGGRNGSGVAGTIAQIGAGGSGNAQSTNPSAAGATGMSATGSQSAPAAAGTDASGSPRNASGCSCRVTGGARDNIAFAATAWLLLAIALRLRRHARRREPDNRRRAA